MSYESELALLSVRRNPYPIQYKYVATRLRANVEFMVRASTAANDFYVLKYASSQRKSNVHVKTHPACLRPLEKLGTFWEVTYRFVPHLYDIPLLCCICNSREPYRYAQARHCDFRKLSRHSRVCDRHRHPASCCPPRETSNAHFGSLF